MSQMVKSSKLEIPDRMRSKLEKYQRQIWTIKLVEGLCAAAFGLLLSYLFVFVLDRFYDTSTWLRIGILLTGTIGLAIWFPIVCHRWIWNSRRLEQVARMLKVNHPRLGDYLLGIIELVNNESYEGTSEALCRAALAQADRETADKDFSQDVPYPKHRRWALIVSVPMLIAIAAMLVVPAAGSNALQRWLMPWKQIDRYTFTRVESLPDKIVVPIGEKTELDAKLTDSSRWNPNTGTAWIGRHRVDTEVDDGSYKFELPPFTDSTDVSLRIGDVLENVKIDPQPRPELASLTALIELPEYLQRTEPVRREIRGGGLSTLNGSKVAIEAQATRTLVSATVDRKSAMVDGTVLRTESSPLVETKVMELAWKDGLGLSAKTPLRLKIRATEDEAPELICRQLEQQRVIMAKDLLSFTLDAADDYGLKTVGMEWKGTPAESSNAQAATGEKVIYAGNPEAVSVNEITATFSPLREEIEPQTIQLRLYAEDYLPNRERVYSQPYTVYVLSEDEHAIWMTRRLNDWYKQSLESYEIEQQLYQRNTEIRNMSAEELDRPETRRKIESQAAAERAQSRRLGALTDAGEKLVAEATRNENFGVDHLEKLAQMLQSLKDIHENRMPSVADLLKKAAESEANSKPSDGDSKSGLSVSDNPTNPGQSSPDGQSNKPEDKKDDKEKAPSVSMSESSMDQPDKEEKKDAQAEPSQSQPGKLGLPSVTLADNSKKDGGGACPAGQKMEEAVESQEELLAEFQKVAEELQQLMSNLEGSTFVKRLKAMSRRELVIAKDISNSTLTGFGAIPSNLKKPAIDSMKLLAKRQEAHAINLQNIEQDLEAYANRVQEGKFKTVLAEMRDIEAVKQVGSVADRMVANESGTSIAHAEFLADTFDRWAEQLVGPG